MATSYQVMMCNKIVPSGRAVCSTLIALANFRGMVILQC